MSDEVWSHEQLLQDGTDGEVLAGLVKIPDRLRALRQAQFAVRKKIDENKADRQAIEDHVYEQVTNARNDDGKPLFTNKELRDAETRARLSGNNTFQKRMTELADLLHKQHAIDTEEAYVADVFKALTFLIRLWEVQK